ncbi:succinylglutamate desuccinylase/aspartoacylase family protein [Maioricimonas sp. JC845]|uniref:succinylglutamate desuccinylase/aspartoacylase family protein n=1 Tax=Maioricimonas sp. JC845 TaxID=3232138 RepID=UPI0034595366
MSGRSKKLVIGGVSVRPGEVKDIRLKISETYTGDPIATPIRVINARRPGPCVFVSAAIHGDELTGTGIIHELLNGEDLELKRGTLLLIPVVNVFGFENHDRYLPDRRDLNRQFPGSTSGSLASRIANTFMEEIVAHCQYGIDLHAAAASRTNFPNVRADLSIPEVRRIARAFGCELVIDGAGPVGCMRREACRKGCATMILEAGEPLKVEPAMLEIGVRGVRNVLMELDMLEGERFSPPYQTTVRKTTWVRAEVGGFLRFHVTPGELVKQGQPVASNFTILGEHQNLLISPVDGVVLGMTTVPAVKPGEPVCHIALPGRTLRSIRKAVRAMDPEDIHQRVRDDMATRIQVTSHDEMDEALEPASDD